jgi:hypothetical protein
MVHDRQALIESIRRRELGERSSAWNRTSILVEHWLNEGHDIPFGWLEFDGDEGRAAGPPEPNPAFGIEPGYFGRYHGPPTPAPRDVALRTTAAAAACLLRPERVEPTMRVIERIVSALPPSGSLVCCTAMIARTPEVMKLYLALPKLSLRPYLTQIGWPGDLDRVSDLVDRNFSAVSSYLFIDLTVGVELEPLIGLAWSQFHAAEAADYDPCREWGRTVSGQGATFESVQEWPGLAETTLNRRRMWIRRWLDFKIVLAPAGDSAIKGYLGFMPVTRLPFA